MKKIKILLITLLTCFSLYVTAQVDTCRPKVCNSFGNSDLYQIYGKLQQIKNLTAGGGTGSDTVYNYNLNIINDPLLARQTTLNFCKINLDTCAKYAPNLYSINANLNYYNPQILANIAEVRGAVRPSTGVTSVFKNNLTDKSVFTTQAENSVFIDTISGKNYSVANSLVSTASVTAGNNLQSIDTRLNDLQIFLQASDGTNPDLDYNNNSAFVTPTTKKSVFYDTITGSHKSEANLLYQIANQTQTVTVSNTPTVVVNNQKNTYSANITGLATAATATDIFTIYGSNTKTVKVLKILISATQTAAGIVNVNIIKRSTANTGGTSTNPTRVPWDVNNVASTATINAYTANPTLGSTIGTVESSKLFVSTTGTNTIDDHHEISFDGLNNQPITLRGTSNGLAVNLGGVTVAGSSFDITVIYTEE